MTYRLLFWIRTALFMVFRTGRSAGVLTLMVMVSVGTMIFLSSLAVGVNDAMVNNSVSLFSGHVAVHQAGAGTAEQAGVLPGVLAVLERESGGALLTHRGSTETVVLYSVDPEKERAFTVLPQKVVEGRYLRPGGRELVVGEPTAERLGLRPGDLVQLRYSLEDEPDSVPVAGVYRSGFDRLDTQMAFTAMPHPGIGVVRSAAVFLHPGTDAEAIAAELQSRSSPESEVQPWTAFFPDLKQLVDLNYVSMGIVMVLVFGVVSLGMACVFVIFIFKSLREYGIMKAMGVTARETAGLILVQVVLLIGLAILLGTTGGVLASLFFSSTGIDLSGLTSHNQYFSVSGVIRPRLTLFSLCLPPVLALISGLLGAVWPAWLVSGKRTAEILRQS